MKDKIERYEVDKLCELKNILNTEATGISYTSCMVDSMVYGDGFCDEECPHHNLCKRLTTHTLK